MGRFSVEFVRLPLLKSLTPNLSRSPPGASRCRAPLQLLTGSRSCLVRVSPLLADVSRTARHAQRLIPSRHHLRQLHSRNAPRKQLTTYRRLRQVVSIEFSGACSRLLPGKAQNSVSMSVEQQVSTPTDSAARIGGRAPRGADGTGSAGRVPARDIGETSVCSLSPASASRSSMIFLASSQHEPSSRSSAEPPQGPFISGKAQRSRGARR